MESFNNSTVRLDLDNEPQPDLVLIKAPEKGGQARISEDDYIERAPELAVEIVESSRAYDLHQKKGAYRRNGVREYLAWVTTENRFAWWELREGEYHENSTGERRDDQEQRFSRPLARCSRTAGRGYESSPGNTAEGLGKFGARAVRWVWAVNPALLAVAGPRDLSDHALRDQENLGENILLLHSNM